jgi:hypothetical protein
VGVSTSILFLRLAPLILALALSAGCAISGAGDAAEGGSGATSSSSGSGGSSSSSGSGGDGGDGGVGAGGTTSSSSSSSGSSSSSTSSGQGGDAPADPCTGTSDGDHCGGELGGNADHSSVYACSGGATQAVTACPLGCDGGSCNTPPSDPCSSAQSGNGLYCGESLAGGTAGTLYNCQNGSTASSEPCPNGCQIAPPNYPDSCAVSGDPCVNAGSGNGLYCGGSLGAGDPNTLYNCQNGQTASSEVCTNGCTIMPPNTPDQCASSGGGSCCVHTPPGALTQSFTACGNGGSHYGIDYGTPVGTPIYAGIAGTVVSHALGYPNCYDNGCTQACWNAFNYVKIVSDCGDPNDGGHDLYVYYLHIDDLAPGIANGSHVDQGQLLAYAGNSGCSSGPHIHIETVSVPSGSNAYLSQCTSVNPTSVYCP